MDLTTFDTFTRFVTSATATTRRSVLGGLSAVAAAAAVGGLFHADESAARKKNPHKNKKRKKHRRKNKQKDQTPATTPPPVNVCKGKNWCVDRSQTCGPAGGHGKCFVESTGDNLCGEILFQAQTCAGCAAPACVNCRCVLAAGGGDRCNNGANGFDFICVRAV